MNIIKDFTFNGRSASSFGVQVADNSEWFATPERDIEHISVPGRSGDLLIDNGRFNNLEINIEVNRLTDARGISELINWLAVNPGYQRLSVSDDPDHYRMASFEGMTQPVFDQLKRTGRVSLPFNCQPQRFLVADEEGITKTYGDAAYTFTNYGDDAKPVIRFTKGQGSNINNPEYCRIIDTAYPEDELFLLFWYLVDVATFNKIAYAEIDTGSMTTSVTMTDGTVKSVDEIVEDTGYLFEASGWADHFGDQEPYIIFKHGHTYSFQYGGGEWDENAGSVTLYTRRWEL